MPDEEKDSAVQDHLRDMTKDALRLHFLKIKRKETAATISQRKKEIEQGVAEDISKRRNEERQKRIKNNGMTEKNLQELTSVLMLELIEICKEDDVPPYVLAIARVLDNFQGGINTIRSNSNWLSELISQLTDQMRNFDAGQKKLEAKFDLLMEKVNFFFE